LLNSFGLLVKNSSSANSASIRNSNIYISVYAKITSLLSAEKRCYVWMIGFFKKSSQMLRKM